MPRLGSVPPHTYGRPSRLRAARTAIAARSFGAFTVWPPGSLICVPLPYWSDGGKVIAGPLEVCVPPPPPPPPPPPARLPIGPDDGAEDGSVPPIPAVSWVSRPLAAVTMSAASLAYLADMPAITAC